MANMSVTPIREISARNELTSGAAGRVEINQQVGHGGRVAA